MGLSEEGIRPLESELEPDVSMGCACWELNYSLWEPYALDC